MCGNGLVFRLSHLEEVTESYSIEPYVDCHSQDESYDTELDQDLQVLVFRIEGEASFPVRTWSYRRGSLSDKDAFHICSKHMSSLHEKLQMTCV